VTNKICKYLTKTWTANITSKKIFLEFLFLPFFPQNSFKFITIFLETLNFVTFPNTKFEIIADVLLKVQIFYDITHIRLVAGFSEKVITLETLLNIDKFTLRSFPEILTRIFNFFYIHSSNVFVFLFYICAIFIVYILVMFLFLFYICAIFLLYIF
jgi:hypothetical protein